jgi:tripeptidyl-peptidase I
MKLINDEIREIILANMIRGLTLCAVASALQAVVLAEGVVLESLRAVPDGWTRLRDASPDQPLRLRIAVEQQNKNLFEQKLYEVSDPDHAMYGKHLGGDEIRELLKPRKESTDGVLGWLRESGISDKDVRNEGDWINFITTVGRANEMLNTTFGVFKPDVDGGAERIRALSYSVPETIVSHVNFIAPIIRFGQLRRMRSHVIEEVVAPVTLQAADIPKPVLNVTACNTTITPECLRALYNVGDYKSEASPNSLFGVAGYLEVGDYSEIYLGRRLTGRRNGPSTASLRNSPLHTHPMLLTRTSPWS